MKISTKILQKIPLVMISMSRWDGNFSSPAWSLTKTFFKNQSFIYVDYPFTVIDYWRERKTAAVIKPMRKKWTYHQKWRE